MTAQQATHATDRVVHMQQGAYVATCMSTVIATLDRVAEQLALLNARDEALIATLGLEWDADRQALRLRDRTP